MPENVPGQAFSDRTIIVGVQIPDADLPYTAFRRLFDLGPHRMERHDKRAEDTLDYFLDLMRWLELNETIRDVRAWAEPGDLKVSRVEFGTTGVVVWLAGGDDDVRHVLKIRVETTRGKAVVFNFVVITNGAPPIFTLLSVEPATGRIAQIPDIVVPPAPTVPMPTAAFSPATLTFGSVVTGMHSAVLTVRLTSTGDEILPIRSIRSTGRFSFSSAAVPQLAKGEHFDISVTFSPNAAGNVTGVLLVDIGDERGEVARVNLSGTGVSAAPVAQITPAMLDFGQVTQNQTSAVQNLTLSNIGNAPMTISGLNITGAYSLTKSPPAILSAGESFTFGVTFTPLGVSPFVGQVALVSNASGQATVNLTGAGIASATPTPAPALVRLSTSGNQIVGPGGAPVRLRAINWFGAESANMTPHGTWARPWRALIDQINAWGFNCIRLPFSGDITKSGATVPAAAISASLNPELVGLSPLQIIDLIVAYCGQKGIYVVLDHHRRNAGAGADGSPIGSGYTVADWKASWATMANRYRDDPTVAGADLHNEPHDLSWSTWAGYAEECANSIHAIAPDWLIIVEGVGAYNGDTYWWGGSLQGVADRPVAPALPNKLVYSPHEYGQSVGTQAWLAYDNGTPPANWPNNLFSVWKAHWGFIFEEGIAPIWVGEFGGKFGTNGAGATGVAPHAAYETQWVQKLAVYLNGDFTGDGSSDLTAGQAGMSFAYWCLNPNSGDTGGLLQDDWQTPQATKITLINPLMAV